MPDPLSGTDETAHGLRVRLAEELTRDGSLRSPQWREAVLAVPRHVFLPAFFTAEDGPDGITRYTVVHRDTDASRWLQLAYENTTWVTQLDHGATPPNGNPSTGTPTSSSTLPGVVVRMLEDLDVPDSANVLEVGTGTGYSTALLCARLGDRYVTSVEHDAALSAADGERLASLGHHPRLIVGDGAKGSPENGPYDRIIATYSPDHVPAPWLAQARPGAIILASLVGSLDAYGYLKLRVGEGGDGGVAQGRFIDSEVSFMLSRETRRPPIGPLMRAAVRARTDAPGLDTTVHPDTLADPSFLWSAQIALPGTTRLRLTADDVTGQWFLHPDGSWAVLESRPDGTRRAFQGGPRALWSELEAAATAWVSNGRPGLERYGLTVTPETNTVWLDTPDNPIGILGP
ncbi:ATP-grasp peptide maturase system methyltransferase [Streptomyces sp. 1331.2]|uniref:ATP-grasp peptide maturase system methyltransferase n=1 Tax=Streptomyces sp. 1331.2 TaxID=1938835 RepID=UPI000BCDF494|nr:ATP-grasp peptide maturase system methyltransferase [Streptomyces sp. 1331.2]SOB84725.1 methyltransferase, ATP-grasp peptide maturase system [Streptomyces sp. 1331.2]